MTEYEMPDFLLAAPEIFMLAMVSVILIVDLFLPDRLRVWTYILTQFTLIATAGIILASGGEDVAYTFNGMFVGDPMSDVLKIAACLSVAVMLAYSRSYASFRGLYRGEFFVLSLFSTLGMMVMISANHFLVLYLGLELMSLSLYAMVALPRDSGISTEAAMKYFVLGALASGMLLYGMSMIYGATGSLEVTEVAQRIADGDAIPTILIFGLVFVVAGIGFKLGAVPFHMWVPDSITARPRL